MLTPNLTYDNTEAQAYLEQRGGSKAGFHAYLFDKHPQLRKHLPKSWDFPHGADPQASAGSMDFDIPKIVRGCHPLDVTGLVNVLQTKIAYTRVQLLRVIQEIRRAAKDPEVAAYSEYESGIPFDGKIHILVQDYHGPHRGSVIEHPHRKGIYRIEEQIPRGVSLYAPKAPNTLVRTYFVDRTNRILDVDKMKDTRTSLAKLSDTQEYMTGIAHPRHLLRAVQLYREIADTGIYPGSHVGHLEFGVDPDTRQIMAYQFRVFRPYEEAQDFDPHEIIRKRESEVYAISSPFQTFGITSGMNLTVVGMNPEIVQKRKNARKMAYCWSNTETRESTGLDVRPTNMKAYFPIEYNKALEHGHYRWIQKADVSIPGLYGIMDFMKREQMRETGDFPVYEDMKFHVHVASNGIFGAIAAFR